MTESISDKEPKEGKVEVSDLPWRILDIFIVYTFLTPLTIAYWRGTENLMVKYLTPHKTHVEVVAWANCFLSTAILYLATILQEYFKSWTRKMHCVVLTILTRIYMYIVSFGSVSQFEGFWHLWGYYVGATVVSGGISCSLGILGLAMSRGLRNVMSAPLGIDVDRNSTCFDVQTRFGTSPKEVWKYVFDALFTVVVFGIFNSLAWQGMWEILDKLVLPGSSPEMLTKSALVSLITGYVISVAFALLQFPAEMLSVFLSTPERRYGKIIFEQFYILIAFFGVLNVWRGYWNLMDVYFLPKQPFLSGWITHVVGYVGMTLLVTSKSNLNVGWDVDGSMPGGTGVRMLTDFITEIREDRHIFANADEIESMHQQPLQKEAVVSNGHGAVVPNCHGDYGALHPVNHNQNHNQEKVDQEP